VTVALNGDGGDESFAGYERYAAMRFAEKYNRIPERLRQLFELPIGVIPTSEVRRSRVRDGQRFVQAAGLPRIERYFRWSSTFDANEKSAITTDEFRHLSGNADAIGILDKWFATANGSTVLDATLLTDLMTYLPNDLLVKVDIASMANSLEARSPFLDHKVIEFAASLPESQKMPGMQTKYLLKKVAARLVPKEVVYRRKMGFGVPVGSWMRHEMRSFLCDVLLSDKSMNRGIIRPEELRRYVVEHTESKRDHAFRLWTLLMLELWFQRFIDQN
jgi:asparagine synthase (glutamine-hydrolysing)